MSWISSDNSSLDDTASPILDVYLSSEEGGIQEYVTLPYTRNVFPIEFEELHLEEIQLTIGRTERKYLQSETRVITPALTISSIPVVYGYYVDGYGYDDDYFDDDDYDDDNGDDDDDDNGDDGGDDDNDDGGDDDDDGDDKSTRSSMSSVEYTTTSSTESSSTFSPSEESTTPPGASRQRRQRRQRRRLVSSSSSSSSSSSTSDYTSYDDDIDSSTYFSSLDDDSFTFLRANDTNASSPSFSAGFLNIYILQGSYSFITIEDIDPLDVGDLLGNIGGFWGYVLLSFAVFFTVAEPEKLPRLRARAFYTKRGNDVIRRLSATSSTSKSPDASQGATEVREQLPDWEDERNGRQGEAEGKAEGETPAIPSSKNPTPSMIRRRSSNEDREICGSQRATSVVVEGEPVGVMG
ncbi:unnamed protein product [Ectocarpus sp. 13 AM-2016]